MKPVRVALFAPGINTKVMSKAIGAGVDAVILDLEDSVPIAAKLEARALVATVIDGCAATPGPAIFVRANGAATGYLADDLAAVVRPGLDAVMLPKAMKFSPGSSTKFQPVDEDPTAQTFVARNIAPGQPIEFTVSGTGAMPREAQGAPSGGEAQGGAMGGSPDGPGETVAAPSGAGADTRPGGGLGVPVGGEDPINKYRWWILGGLSVILAIAAGVLLRKPATPLPAPVPAGHFAAVPPPPPNYAAVSAAANAPASMLAVLKEELFSLETERLEGKISDAEYVQLKAAFETVLRRTLARQPQ